MRITKRIILSIIIVIVVISVIANYKTYGTTMTGITPITSFEAENTIGDKTTLTEEEVNELEILTPVDETDTNGGLKYDGSDGIIVEDGATTDLTDMFSKINSIKSQEEALSSDKSLPMSEAELAEADLDNNIYEDDYYAIEAGKVTIDKFITGNVYIIADEVVINGDIKGNVFIIADKITHNAEVNGSVYELADDVRFEGESYITGSVYIITNDFKAIKDVDFNQDLRIICGDTFDMNSNVYRKLYVYANNVVLNQGMFVKNGGEINYYGELNDQSIDYAELTHKVESAEKKIVEVNAFVNSIKFRAIKYVATLILILVLASISYKYGMKYDSSKQSIINRAGAKGIIHLILVPIVGVLFLISFIGTPVGILLITAWCTITFILAVPSLSLYLSRTVLKKEDKSCGSFAKEVLLAIGIYIVIDLLRIIPVIGAIASVVAVAWGYGVVISSIESKCVKKCKCCSKDDSEKKEEIEQTEKIENNNLDENS